MTDYLPLPVALEAFVKDGENVHDQLRMLMQLEAILDFVKYRKDEVRDRLHDNVDALTAATGTAFTARDGELGSALLTDPQPRASFNDQTAFVAQLEERGLDKYGYTYHEYEWNSDGEDADIIEDLAKHVVTDPTDSDIALAFVLAFNKTFKLRTRSYVTADAVDLLVQTGRIELVPPGAVWTDDGERVAGVSSSQGKPQLQVRLDSKTRKAYVAHLHSMYTPDAIEEVTE